MQKCTGCSKTKPLADFYEGSRKCKECRKQAVAEWQAANPEKAKSYKKKHKAAVSAANRERRPALRTCPTAECCNLVLHKSGPVPRCPSCSATSLKAATARADKSYAAKKKAWLARQGADYAWAKQIKYQYGILAEEWYQILAEQGGGCAICGARTLRPDDQKRLATDHCHDSGAIRGLLCDRHNTALHHGLTPDELRRMANYLEQLPKHYGKAVKRPDRAVKPCGTYAAYMRHKRNSEEPCQPCKTAANEYHKKYRK